MTITPSLYSYWGGHFPTHRRYWGGHFPEPGGRLVAFGPPGAHGTVTPIGPPGIPLVLALESGAVISQSWETDVFKARSGKERRASLLDSPKESYKGSALIAGGDVRLTRGQLARYAAMAVTWQLGLPHEAISVARATSTEAVPVGSTALLDWANPGQRCLARGADGSTLSLVLQSATVDTLYFDIPLGALGLPSTVIMPTVPVFLEPTQQFGRYQPSEPVEQWQIAARSLQFGTRSAAVAAVLVPPTGGVLAGLAIVARTPGSAGNAITVQLEAATLGVGVNVTITENLLTDAVLVKFRTGVATVQQLVDAFATAALASIEGNYTPTDVLHSGTDEWVPVPLAGGLDAAVIAPGRGASLTTYDSRPVYDRGLQLDTTASDSLQSLTDLVDLGGVPLNSSDTNIADWGRQAMMASSRPADRQWLKLFLATAKGRQKSWWLPSWRADLLPLSQGAGAAAVTAKLPLAPPIANSGAMDGLTIEALVAGAAGNAITVTMTGDAIATAGEFSDGGGAITIRFAPTVTTDTQIKTLVNGASALVRITGTTSGLALQSGDDEFSASLYGGIDAIGSTLTIDTTAPGGDFAAWFPARDRLQLKQSDGTITYTRILSTSSGVLSLDVALSGSPVVLVSWLELVRFESDDVATTYTGPRFSLNQQARVVQLRTDGAEVTFDDFETSAESSTPRYGIEMIATLTQTERISTSDQDVIINGFTYRAQPGQVGVIAVDVAGAAQSVEITLPSTHALVKRYANNGIPPRQVAVNVYRLQPGGVYEQVWTGLATSLAINGHTAKFLVPARTGDTTQRRLPTQTAGVTCGHILFDRNCKADRAAFTVTTTATLIAGGAVTVASIGGKPDHWADLGELVHVPSGERMTIASQVGTLINIQFPIAELRDGDAVTVSAGCTHQIGPVVTSPPTLGFGCKDGFNNVVNFSNQPNLKLSRAYTTGSRGSTAIGQPRHQVP